MKVGSPAATASLSGARCDVVDRDKQFAGDDRFDQVGVPVDQNMVWVATMIRSWASAGGDDHGADRAWAEFFA